jgi:uncharacterized membrane protein
MSVPTAAPQRPAFNRPIPAPARSAVYASWILSLAGLGISIYLTVAHFAGTEVLACAENGVINCAKVTTSPQSYVFGIPVAILGLGFYAVMVVINLAPLWRLQHRWVHVVRLGLVVTGMAFVLYLVSAELFIIDSICLWCSAVHVVTLALFIAVLSTVPRMLGNQAEPDER